jgi:hypothetical protein
MADERDGITFTTFVFQLAVGILTAFATLFVYAEFTFFLAVFIGSAVGIFGRRATVENKRDENHDIKEPYFLHTSPRFSLKTIITFDCIFTSNPPFYH